LSRLANENALFENKEELPDKCRNQINFEKMVERREFVF